MWCEQAGRKTWIHGFLRSWQKKQKMRFVTETYVKCLHTKNLFSYEYSNFLSIFYRHRNCTRNQHMNSRKKANASSADRKTIKTLVSWLTSHEWSRKKAVGGWVREMCYKWIWRALVRAGVCTPVVATVRMGLIVPKALWSTCNRLSCADLGKMHFQAEFPSCFSHYKKISQLKLQSTLNMCFRVVACLMSRKREENQINFQFFFRERFSLRRQEKKIGGKRLLG